MRLCYTTVCAVLIVGCQSPRHSRHENVRIADSLERQITADEARHILFDDIDRDIEAAQARPAAEEGVGDVVTDLSQVRQGLSSRFDSFLERSREGDELWMYRTHVTADRRGGESGFALVRKG